MAGTSCSDSGDLKRLAWVNLSRCRFLCDWCCRCESSCEGQDGADGSSEMHEARLLMGRMEDCKGCCRGMVDLPCDEALQGIADTE